MTERVSPAKRPAVTVVIPTRANGRGVDRAVTSVLDQTGVEARVMVVVDGEHHVSSTADGVWLTRLTRPHRVVYAGAYGRPGPLRTLGAGLAETDLVGFLDDDDEFVSGKLVRQLVELEDPGVSIVGSNATLVEADGSTRPYHPSSTPRNVDLRAALLSNPFITSSVLTRSSSLRRVGGFPGSVDLKYCDDYVTWLKLLTLGKGVNLPEELVVYRAASPESLSVADGDSGAEIRVLALQGLEKEAAELSLRLDAKSRRVAARLLGRR